MKLLHNWVVFISHNHTELVVEKVGDIGDNKGNTQVFDGPIEGLITPERKSQHDSAIQILL